LDIPDTVLGQLGNRVQHALRAFTPRDQKAVKTAATTMRANPALDVEKVIGELGVGEALVSLLDEKGQPTIVERAFILPPHSRIGPAAADERRAAMQRSLVAGVYENTVDRDSAHEVLKARREATAAAARQPAATSTAGGSVLDNVLGGVLGGGNSRRQSAGDAMMKSAARAIGSEVGRRVIRGVLGSILGGGGRR
ncbi:MAG: helicase HerA-like domain-containing protein, partial [Burkholderiales bacterium]